MPFDEKNKSLINLSILEFIVNVTRSVIAPIFPVIIKDYLFFNHSA